MKTSKYVKNSESSTTANVDKPADVNDRKIYLGGFVVLSQGNFDQIFLLGVPVDMTDRDIYMFLSKFGPVEYVLGREGAGNYRYAFVTFESKETAQAVLTADISKLTTRNGCRLRPGLIRENNNKSGTRVYRRRPQSVQSWEPKDEVEYNRRKGQEFTEGGSEYNQMSQYNHHSYNFQHPQQVGPRQLEAVPSPEFQYNYSGAGAAVAHQPSIPYYFAQYPTPYYLPTGQMIWPQASTQSYSPYKETSQYSQDFLNDLPGDMDGFYPDHLNAN